MSDEEVSSVPVEVRLLKIQPIIGRGTLKWLFSVLIDIQGVELTVQGFQGRQSKTGGVSIHAPQFRGDDGKWVPALVLPDNVLAAVGDAFVEEIGRSDLSGRGTPIP